jgi:mono/diheme cytochrome c family protein
MSRSRIPRRKLSTACVVLVAAAASAMLLMVDAEADPASVAFGKSIYQDKANCAACHGWAGDGQGDPHAPGHAANLRSTALDRAQLIEVIACGRPGTPMPHFDAYAYSDDPCYGLNEAAVGKNVPPEPPNSLQPKEIEAVADFLQATIVGKGAPTKVECAAYFGSAGRCDKYP